MAEIGPMLTTTLAEIGPMSTTSARSSDIFSPMLATICQTRPKSGQSRTKSVLFWPNSARPGRPWSTSATLGHHRANFGGNRPNSAEVGWKSPGSETNVGASVHNPTQRRFIFTRFLHTSSPPPEASKGVNLEYNNEFRDCIEFADIRPSHFLPLSSSLPAPTFAFEHRWKSQCAWLC